MIAYYNNSIAAGKLPSCSSFHKRLLYHRLSFTHHCPKVHFCRSWKINECQWRGGSIFNWLAGAATDRSCDPPVATGSCQNQTGSCQYQTGSCQSGTGRSRDLPGWQLQAAAVDCDYNATARKYTIFYESVFLDD